MSKTLANAAFHYVSHGAGTQHMDEPGHVAGWRVSMGIAGGFGLILLIGTLIIPDSPNSLVYRCVCLWMKYGVGAC